MFDPTRLIEIGLIYFSSGPDLCITYQVPPGAPYITLSHTWGTAEFIKLTKSTSQSLQYGFQNTDLRKTFRVAITITRKFGVKYLWIDSLCILQDFAEDWLHEAAQMGEIYYNSLCNVAATGASNSDQGCFFDQDTSLIFPCIVKSEWNNKSNHDYYVIEAFFGQSRSRMRPSTAVDGSSKNVSYHLVSCISVETSGFGSITNSMHVRYIHLGFFLFQRGPIDFSRA